MKMLVNLRLALPAAVISLAAAAFAYAAVEELPRKGPVPPARPAVGELLAAVSNIPRPRPDFAEPMPDIDHMPAEERACRGNLIALGVEFEELDEIEGEGKCGIAFPLKVTSLGGGVKLSPDAVVNCATAETAARLVQETARPAARLELGADIAGVRHASAYVCRHRWSGEKISEHARGNALDIAAFFLEDGRTVAVQAYGPADMPERRFMATVRRNACGPFKTVLGPGTDADHALHFHFDLAQRRRGSTYCR